ncbi:colicin immunity domain-containing protein [Mangrovactinospora gilvigrisea]|uniref:colicin immunity domain-containing protein n=1 Tax=Mangrovactinospora gilvigrisea TaxID=1428644 RepID=UPI0008FCD703|nr:colicin immunity domain-containing protein [Mangrovactinospora gilvigrisea]
MDTRIEPFLIIASAMLQRRIKAPEFETVFLALFRGPAGEIRGDAGDAVSRLFSAVDSYCADPELRDDHDLDEQSLRLEVARFIERVKEIYGL